MRKVREPYSGTGNRVAEGYEGAFSLCPSLKIIQRSEGDARELCLDPSGIARICCEEGQGWKLDYRALTANFRAGCSR